MSAMLKINRMCNREGQRCYLDAEFGGGVSWDSDAEQRPPPHPRPRNPHFPGAFWAEGRSRFSYLNTEDEKTYCPPHRTIRGWMKEGWCVKSSSSLCVKRIMNFSHGTSALLPRPPGNSGLFDSLAVSPDLLSTIWMALFPSILWDMYKLWKHSKTLTLWSADGIL